MDPAGMSRNLPISITIGLMGAALPLIQASLIGEALESGPAVVLVADDEMRYLAVNRYACELLGYTREELLAMRIPDLAVSDEVEAHFSNFLARQEWHGTYRLRHKDGSVHEYAGHASETTVGGMPFVVAVLLPS